MILNRLPKQEWCQPCWSFQYKIPYQNWLHKVSLCKDAKLPVPREFIKFSHHTLIIFDYFHPKRLGRHENLSHHENWREYWHSKKSISSKSKKIDQLSQVESWPCNARIINVVYAPFFQVLCTKVSTSKVCWYFPLNYFTTFSYSAASLVIEF